NVRPFLIHITGKSAGLAHLIEGESVVVGRASNCPIKIDEQGVSRHHLCISRNDADQRYYIEDLGSSNGTVLNGRPLTAKVPLEVSDKIQIGLDTILKFQLFDEVEERYHRVLHQAMEGAEQAGVVSAAKREPWTPDSWRAKPVAQDVPYDD